jgi:hypothetical protein
MSRFIKSRTGFVPILAPDLSPLGSVRVVVMLFRPIRGGEERIKEGGVRADCKPRANKRLFWGWNLCSLETLKGF